MITNFAPIYPIPLPKTVQRLLEFGQLRFMFERKRDLQFWQLVCAKAVATVARSAGWVTGLKPGANESSERPCKKTEMRPVV